MCPLFHGKKQVSVDGITWLDEGTDFTDMKKEGNRKKGIRERLDPSAMDIGAIAETTLAEDDPESRPA